MRIEISKEIRFVTQGHARWFESRLNFTIALSPFSANLKIQKAMNKVNCTDIR